MPNDPLLLFFFSQWKYKMIFVPILLAIKEILFLPTVSWRIFISPNSFIFPLLYNSYLLLNEFFIISISINYSVALSVSVSVSYHYHRHYHYLIINYNYLFCSVLLFFFMQLGIAITISQEKEPLGTGN